MTRAQHGKLNRNSNTHNLISIPILETESTTTQELRSICRTAAGGLEHYKVPVADQGLDWSDVEEDVSGIKGNAPEISASFEDKPALPAGNWGDVSILQNFSGANARAQRESSVNHEDINHIAQQGRNTGRTDSVLSPLRMPSPKTQSSCEDSKNSNAKKAETPAELPKAANKADEPIAVARPVAPRPQPTKQTPKAEFVSVEPQKTEINIPVLDHAANNASGVKSGPTAEEIVALVLKRINKLHIGQGAGKEPLMARVHSPHNEGSSASTRRDPKQESPAPTARETHIPRGTTPGQFAAQNFFEKALRAAPMSSAKSMGCPEDPSDSSSSETD
ncbi:hypothetical protein DFH08DRAFT_973737 [Mycena albidolilacea]|uniref:Uncharacterized protein n=1 Tax=Mycena albidolilacea TaxID=1033008 RepID=A0AAD7EC83_9AGAR|nr:hypothetical protein DFH08DRAFT_973737 [Mycena albidolilacea]